MKLDTIAHDTWTGALLARLRLQERAIEHSAANEVALLARDTTTRIVDGRGNRRSHDTSHHTDACLPRRIWWGFAPDGLIEAVAVETPYCGCGTRTTLTTLTGVIERASGTRPTRTTPTWDVRTRHRHPETFRDLDQVASIMRHWNLLPSPGDLDIDPMSHLLGDLVDGLPHETLRNDVPTSLIWVQHPVLRPSLD